MQDIGELLWTLHVHALCSASLLSRVQLSVTPWTVAYWVSLSLGSLQARTLQGVAMPSCKRPSQPRDQPQVSRIAGGFFTNWATSGAQEYWSGYPIPSSGELPDPGIEPGSLAFLVVSLPAELPGKPLYVSCFMLMHFVYILFIPVVTKKVPSRPQIRNYAFVFTFKNYQRPQFLVKS